MGDFISVLLNTVLRAAIRQQVASEDVRLGRSLGQVVVVILLLGAWRLINDRSGSLLPLLPAITVGLVLLGAGYGLYYHLARFEPRVELRKPGPEPRPRGQAKNGHIGQAAKGSRRRRG